MDVDLLLQVLGEACPDADPSLQVVPVDEVFLTLASEYIRPAVHMLVGRFDVRHLSAISGEDMGDEIVLLYHFWDQRGLTLRTTLTPERPHIATITDLVPGADFYEREVAEMLGVSFKGHADLRPLLLPDDWDKEPPLRQARDETTEATEATEATESTAPSEGQESVQ